MITVAPLPLCRVFILQPVRFLSSKLSTCDQLSYRTDHMRALSSVKAAAGHAHFMKWVIAESTDTIPPTECASV